MKESALFERFPLGRIVMTMGVQSRIPPDLVLLGLLRHAQGDWGEVCDEDRRSNDIALKEQSRLLSVYTTLDGTRFWIITEWDRSYTTILLPMEY